jgi:predicted NUDIX family phosphoesterase
MDEQVLVFPTSLLNEIGYFSGIKTGDEAQTYLDAILKEGVCYYVKRDWAEENYFTKQIIPYTVLRYEQAVYAYQRSKKSGETRLHDKWSIGVGGHINPVDGNPSCINETYENAFWRELMEEVKLGDRYNSKIVGIISDDNNPVGKVHFGIVHIVDLPKDFKMTCNDPALKNGSFQFIEYLRKVPHNFETWSELVLKHIL